MITSSRLLTFRTYHKVHFHVPGIVPPFHSAHIQRPYLLEHSVLNTELYLSYPYSDAKYTI